MFCLFDVTLLISGSMKNISSTISNLESDLTRVCGWTIRNILELNDDKSTVM
jgi:hypothetical protein